MLRNIAVVFLIFFAATTAHAPSDAAAMEGTPSLRWGKIAVGLPRALSGDSPHYLVAVHSLIEDGDFDLKNNYDQALGGDWDAGSRFRGRRIDRHVDVDDKGRELGTHSPFFALMLAFFAWPLAGTRWVEPLCVWLTCTAGLAAVLFMARHLGKSRGRTVNPLLVASLASPLLCYSRDIWTEPWIAAIWLALLSARSLSARIALGCLGTLIKYPFFVVPLTLGIVHCLRGRKTSGLALVGASVVAMVIVIGTVQWIFQDVTQHQSLLHSGVHAGFRLNLRGVVGLLFDPANGLLIFFPVLLWASGGIWKDLERWLPLVTFFAVHAFYADWMGGTGFGSRYMVPMVPLLMLSVNWPAMRSSWFAIAALYSLGWGLAAGFLPALVYDRTPWEILAHTWTHLGRGGWSTPW